MARRRAQPLEQTTLDLGPARPAWTFSRLALRSPHLARIRERIEFVRGFFPELNGIWVRPRRLEHFTIAHELTHLLQARGLVPGGERACDLWALARSPLLVDHPPGYLAVPRFLRRPRRLEPAEAQLLYAAARRAIEARKAGDRRYLLGFERDVAA